ncbi:hypothetical protein NL676_004456 [Syzygium grande]|nr:hypothetical protein NL676_004456 [Syzygium grande]
MGIAIFFGSSLRRAGEGVCARSGQIGVSSINERERRFSPPHSWPSLSRMAHSPPPSFSFSRSPRVHSVTLRLSIFEPPIPPDPTARAECTIARISCGSRSISWLV